MIKTFLFALALLAQNQPADDGSALMNKALTSTGFYFAKSTSGLSYTVDFDHPGGTTRRVYVATAYSKVAGLPQHTVYSTLWTGKEAPSAKIVEWSVSQVKKLGTFYIFKDTQGTYAIRFSCHFDASVLSAEPKAEDASVIGLKDMIYFVNQVAEEASKEIAKL